MNWDPLRLRYKYKTGDRVLVDGSPKYYARVIREVKNPHIGEAVKSPVAKGNRAISHARAVCRSIYQQWNKNSVRPGETHYEVEFEFDGHSGIVSVEDMVLVGDNHHLPASEFFHWWNDKVNLMRRGYGKARALPFLVSFLPFISIWPYLLPPGLHRGNYNSTLVSVATGNFTAAATWALCDNGTGAESDSESTTALTTTGNQDSSTFTFSGAVTVDAILVKYAGGSTTGTVTAILRNSTSGTDVVSATVNASDFVSTVGASTQGGWYALKVTPTVVLGATNYVIRITASVASNCRFYVSTGTNWSRNFRTTTTQAPAANDKLIVIGEFIAAATSSSFTVTQDNTATTTFGPVAASAFGFEVGNKGTVTWGVAASTNYYLKNAGRLQICGGGFWNMGQSGNTIPTTSTMTLEMLPQANVDTGVEVRQSGTWNCYGPSISVLKTKLAADAAAAATSLTSVDTTNWKSGWVACIGSTTRTSTECESKALGADASGTAIGTIAALTYAHSGTTAANNDLRAEVGLLTRYCVIKGQSASLCSYIQQGSGTTAFNMSYVEMTFLGSGTSNKTGVNIRNMGNTILIDGCSLHDFNSSSSIGLDLQQATLVGGGITYSNNISYNIRTFHIYQPSPSSGVNTFTESLGMLSTATSSGIFSIADVGNTYTNLTAIGGGDTGGNCRGLDFLDYGGTIANMSGLKAGHGGGSTSIGILIAATSGYASNLTVTRWNGYGISINGAGRDVGVDGYVTVGCATAGATLFNNATLRSGTFNAGTTLTCPVGLLMSAVSSSIANIKLESCSFGTTTTHATGDISWSSIPGFGVPFPFTIQMQNCILSSSTKIVSQTSLARGTIISSQKDAQVAGAHKSYLREGNIQTDAIIYNGASGKSARLTPLIAAEKLRTYVGSVRVPSGATCTPSIYVYKDSAYNGNQPRLVVVRNIAAGISADTVLATYSSGTGSWNQISGTTAAVTDDCVLDFFVDCDGTAGWINADTFSAARSSSPSTIGEMNYWQDGQPASQWENISGSSAGGFLTQGILGGMRG